MTRYLLVSYIFVYVSEEYIKILPVQFEKNRRRLVAEVNLELVMYCFDKWVKMFIRSRLHSITDSIEEESLPSLPKLNANEDSSRSNTNKTNPDIIRSVFKNLPGNYKSSEEVIYPYKPVRRSSNVIQSVKTALYQSHISNSIYEQEERPSFHSRPLTQDTSYCILLPKLNPEERKLMQMVLDDDVTAAEDYLRTHSGVNVNCTDFKGMSPLHIAVQNQSLSMVEFLSRHRDIDFGDNVLLAIQDECPLNILVTLLNAQRAISPGLEFAGAAHSARYPEYITPLILAAQLGRYEMVELLLTRGHVIKRPHKTRCRCVTCKNGTVNDTLYSSRARLAVYKAISSPAYIVQMCTDPILDAFHLSMELGDNARAQRTLMPEYLNTKMDLSAFAVDLLACCRTSQEVEMLLKQKSGSECRQFILPRLYLALEYRQKEFVAHPNTQMVLKSYWMGDLSNFKNKSVLSKAWVFISRIIIMPFIVFMCMVAPRHRLVRHWQIPFNKLISHSAAYLVFLGLVFYISNQDKSAQKRGPPNTGAEAAVILYVAGYCWSSFRMCILHGPRRYFSELWNWCEIIMLSLFALTILLWAKAAVEVPYDDAALERKYWSQYDPTLLAEGTFCLATILAFFRLMFLLQLNYHLGPLQVSLGKMIIDIYKYIIVFAIIMIAFAAGLSRLYQYYEGMVYEDKFGMKTVQVASFTSFTNSLKTLFWALFCMAPLESGDVVIGNTHLHGHHRVPHHYENKHTYTERIGYFCFGCFEVISVIVVLNMLIATMSNTFQRVTDNAAIEWTFGKTQTYIVYMSQTTLPSPFNMLPTANGMGDVIDWLRNKLFRASDERWPPSCCFFIEKEDEPIHKDEYAALMSVLIQRYYQHIERVTSKSNNSTSRKTSNKVINVFRNEQKKLHEMIEQKNSRVENEIQSLKQDVSELFKENPLVSSNE